MRKDILFLALLVLCTASKAAAQTNAQTSPSPAAQESREQRKALPPPILGLIGDRERLSLTSEQVSALDSIYERWNVENSRLTQTGMVMTPGFWARLRGRNVPNGSREANGKLARPD